MKMLLKLLLSVLSVFVLSFVSLSGVWAIESLDIPELPEGDRTWVVDFGNVVSPATEGEITSKLDAIEKTTGVAIRFLTVQRIDFGQPAEEFLTEVFAKWFPTPEAGKNQALLLIASEDHRTAWRAGEGVAAIVAPETAESIITETMLPGVQESRFNQAIAEGAKRLVAILSGEPDPGPPIVVAETVPVEAAKPIDSQTSMVWVLGLLVVATIVPMATYFFLQKP